MAPPLPPPVRRDLLVLARRAVEVYLSEGRRLVVGVDCPSIAPEPRGAFVTLKRPGGALRGCIGIILPSAPLDETVARMAVSAAVEDPRFPPVSLSELRSLSIEISALTVPQPVPTVEAIEVGRHGLIVSRGGRKGLLLPQVPLEWGWDRQTFLEQTCLKAGLPRGAWREPGTRIEWFEAEVWGEGVPG